MLNATQEMRAMKKNKKRAGKSRKVKRHIGIDLHTDCFTFCILRKKAEPETHTWLLQGGLERFIEILRPGDEVAQIGAVFCGGERILCQHGAEGFVATLRDAADELRIVGLADAWRSANVAARLPGLGKSLMSPIEARVSVNTQFMIQF